MGDCAINIHPTEDELVEIAGETAQCAKTVSYTHLFFAGNGNFRAIDMAVKDRQSSEADYFPEN